MAIFPSAWGGLEFDVVDIGGILRRADQAMVLVWASEDFLLSQVADEETRRFCDIALSLPASAESLELFLRPTLCGSLRLGTLNPQVLKF